MKFDDIHRTLYMNLRKRLIQDQLILDLGLYTGGQETQYAADLSALGVTNGLGSAAELFGVGASEKRVTKADSRVVINHKDSRPGAVGASPVIKFVPYEEAGVTKFRKYKMWDQTYTLIYEIRTVAASSAMDRKLQEALDAVFGMRRYIPFWNGTAFSTDEAEWIFVQFQQSTEVTATELIERVYRLVVDDVFIGDMELLGEGIPEITDITPVINTIPFPPPDPPEDDCDPVRVHNTDDTYDQEVPAGQVHQLPNVTHTDSDGSPVVLPGMTPFVATPCVGGPAVTDYYYAIAMGHP